MITKYSTKFHRDLTVIYPGEYFSTRKNVVIATLLGTCIAACLIDEQNGIYGMNHFLLPYQSEHKQNFFLDKNGLYGVAAMELLINDMMKIGANKKFMKAKIFGAGSILGKGMGISYTVTQNNINFVTEFLETENIPIISKDVGGDMGRKIFFFTEKSGAVLLKRIMNEKLELNIKTKEEIYKEKIIEEQNTRQKKTEFKTSIIFGEDL